MTTLTLLQSTAVAGCQTKLGLFKTCGESNPVSHGSTTLHPRISSGLKKAQRGRAKRAQRDNAFTREGGKSNPARSNHTRSSNVKVTTATYCIHPDSHLLQAHKCGGVEPRTPDSTLEFRVEWGTAADVGRHPSTHQVISKEKNRSTYGARLQAGGDSNPASQFRSPFLPSRFHFKVAVGLEETKPLKTQAGRESNPAAQFRLPFLPSQFHFKMRRAGSRTPHPGGTTLRPRSLSRAEWWVTTA
ncbi:hypothetical protein C8R46DRAFT_1034725 [Mycena filopes]|nr:hypothetical protein C8R46DRAFT_1034725 [Mycena filopes]